VPKPGHPVACLVVAGALAACPAGGGGDIRAAVASPTPAPTAGGTSASAEPSTSPSIGPAPSPTAPSVVERIEILPKAITLYTPRDTLAPAAFPDAGFPSRAQLVATVFYRGGTMSSEVAWHSENAAMVTVDGNGWVEATMPRGTGKTRVVATALADSNRTAVADVTVLDSGKVQVDVF
jgi:hypothetical protein